MISNGVNPLVVRDLLGHTSVDMTAHYTHINLETKRAALQNLNVLPSPSPSNLIKGESITAMITGISSEKLAAVGRWLEDNLTPEQRNGLMQVLK